MPERKLNIIETAKGISFWVTLLAIVGNIKFGIAVRKFCRLIYSIDFYSATGMMLIDGCFKLNHNPKSYSIGVTRLNVF